MSVTKIARVQYHCALNEANMCIFQGETKKDLNRHIENIHRKKNQIQCTVCDLYFRNVDDLARHMRMTHKTKFPTLKCSQCEKDFKLEKELKKHIGKIIKHKSLAENSN